MIHSCLSSTFKVYSIGDDIKEEEIADFVGETFIEDSRLNISQLLKYIHVNYLFLFGKGGHRNRRRSKDFSKLWEKTLIHRKMSMIQLMILDWQRLIRMRRLNNNESNHKFFLSKGIINFRIREQFLYLTNKVFDIKWVRSDKEKVSVIYIFQAFSETGLLISFLFTHR